MCETHAFGFDFDAHKLSNEPRASVRSSDIERSVCMIIEYSGYVNMATRRILAAATPLLGRPAPTLSTRAWRLLHEPRPDGDAWPDYLLDRGWLNEQEFMAADERTRHVAMEILSAALTFPLTVARAWPLLDLPSGPSVRLGVVGARAEAALPEHFWAELALLVGGHSIDASPRTQFTLDIEFSGPASAPTSVPQRRVVNTANGSAMSMALGEADLFHRGTSGQALLAAAKGELDIAQCDVPDAYVLFNPGLGEPGWERAWRPTLRALDAANRPMLFTALSPSDAARDVNFIEAMQADRIPRLSVRNAEVAYAENPFASLMGVKEEEGAASPSSTAPSSSSSSPSSAATTTASSGGSGLKVVSSRPSNTHWRVL